MNKSDLDNLPPFPPEWETTEAEEITLTLERLRSFQETGMGVPLDEVLAWLEARRSNPNAPRPTSRKLF